MKIAIAGATGDLGTRIVRHLHRLEADVRCLVRPASLSAATTRLGEFTHDIVPVDMDSEAALTKALAGCDVVVSAVSGLRPVIVDFQTRLLHAAVAAGVPRFMPSDYAIDYRKIPAGENRNLNLRTEFQAVVDSEPRIRATSVLNGAFMDMLTGVAPFILYGPRRILCWGDPDQKMDWTTIEDTAEVAAHAALDADAPRFVHVAGDELSARDLAAVMTDITGKRHSVFRPGGVGLLGVLIRITRLFVPGGNTVYPPWQGMQYMHSMYSGKVKFPSLDNGRYPVAFTPARSLLSEFLAGSRPAYALNG